jgi:hypothetical protein
MITRDVRHGIVRDPCDAVRAEARRARRRTALAAAAVLAALIGAAVLLTSPAPTRPHTASPAAAGSAVAAAPSPAAPFAPPLRWISLPPATGAVGQMPTGFPHTEPGAAAFAVQVVQFSWTASYDQAQRAAALYADPPGAAAAAQAVAFAAQLRTLAGIPATGAPPAATGISARVLGLSAAPDGTAVSVDLLVEMTATSGAGQSRTLSVATTVRAAWNPTHRDWRYTAASLPCPRAADEVGTAGFNGAGWSAVQPAAP